MIKKILASILLISVLVIFIQCPTADIESPPAEYFPSEPEALKVNDNSNDGIYKGVITGKNRTAGKEITGSFKMVANNDIPNRASSNSIYVILNFNGETATIDGSSSWDGYCYDYIFINDKYNFKIPILKTGTVDTYNVSLIVKGYENKDVFFYFNISKETSDKLIKAYEGNFNGSGSYSLDSGGTINYTIKGVWNTIIEETSTEGAYFGGCYISDSFFQNINAEFEGQDTGNNNWNISLNDGRGTATGKVYERYASGTWIVGSDKGTWYGKRKF
ncbi:MAG TPA: hypothetical protein PK385_07880 [Spirochaetota bacterium]|nr:hypothetical protein [Spirochaetota bacterium]HOS33021.1 hypothetical protein [Spirochaetota bacterium]HOS55962.1 hypothetical protein [Spirochaetota bacterium]HPK61539.1 hypothetical protein [Spirochaetota bacterium]HQF78445.1 hypothetical protein [Spirochaetota bacterium]